MKTRMGLLALTSIRCPVFGWSALGHFHFHFHFCFLLSAFCFAVLPILAPAAEKKIEVSLLLEETEIPVGVATFAQVQVIGGYPEEVPGELNVPGLKILKTSISYRNQFQDGKSVAATQILYSVTGEKAGDYVLPSFDVKLGGRTHGTKPVTIRVLAPGRGQEGLQASRALFMNFRADKTEAYVNELVPIELLLYAKGADSIAKSSAPEFQGLEQFLVQRFPLNYTPSTEMLEGLPFTSMRFPTHVAGLAEGRHVLGPARVEVGIRRGASPVYPPGMPGNTEERTVVSNHLEFVIKPLPDSGRPASFQGAVGRFELEVSATPERVRLGDPLDVTIRIQGQGNFDNLSAPSLPETAGWRMYPVVRSEGDRQPGLEQTVTFSQVAIPLEPVTALPSIEFSFFDPAEEKYVTRRTASIPLQVESSPAAGALPGSGLARWGISSTQLDDILFIREELSSLRPLTAATKLGAGFWLAQAFFFTLLLGILAYGARLRLRKWRAARSSPDEVTFSLVQTRFGEAKLGWPDYYRLVFGYLDTVRRPGVVWPERLSRESRVTLEQVTQAGESALYAGGEAAAGAVPRFERAQTLRALREWERSRRRT